MAAFDNWLDGLDLAPVHFWASLAGAFLTIYVMTLLSKGWITIEHECKISYWARRFSLAILAMALCWSAIYAHTWAPYPPDLAIIIGINGVMVAGIIVAWRRRQAEKKVVGFREPDRGRVAEPRWHA